jgi:hypothetical protein
MAASTSIASTGWSVTADRQFGVGADFQQGVALPAIARYSGM